RFEAFKALAEGAGITVKSVHWTTGNYDMVLVTEGAEDALMTLNLQMAALGNVRTQTLRGFSAAEMRKLVSGLK
ncbi:MAG: GYD domain-containing protein, partial [Rubrivivax sp.]|nr:GYD domain-containing protein [Rubrivivax sp.]